MPPRKRSKQSPNEVPSHQGKRAASIAAYVDMYPGMRIRLARFANWLSQDFALLGVSMSVLEAGDPNCRDLDALTPAERRLAQCLLEGGKLSDYAKAQGVSRHTVRNQLQSIFQKTGTNRQAALVSHLSGILRQA